MKILGMGVLILALTLFLASAVQAQQVGFTQADRERIDQRFEQAEKRMIRIETTLEMFMKSTNQRFEQMDKGFEQMQNSMDQRFEQMQNSMDQRFEQMQNSMDQRFEQMQNSMDKRFEQVDKRFEQVDKRFEEMLQFMKILAGIFATITVAVIGFGYWDRRTTVSKAKEVTLEALATETENPQVRALLEWVVAEVIRRLESRKESQPLSTPLQANV